MEVIYVMLYSLSIFKDSFLISGGNDQNVFIWTLGSEVTGYNVFHGEKVSAFEGTHLDRIIVADFSPVIQVRLVLLFFILFIILIL
ncbi:hypothetical protein Smp_182140 [Schistosoma mansoni]|uniref:hypothetical protein n=1 Tax=Schistosoma mansoni TaxID=6183 RepID=UPI00022DC9EC|nr:hypothetical protein Smp_182140 [Schistosoma mansoni]|eukprot:XP_018654877.1 hypothetical protein Smp_182140 [Schistosoma mansoni]